MKRVLCWPSRSIQELWLTNASTARSSRQFRRPAGTALHMRRRSFSRHEKTGVTAARVGTAIDRTPQSARALGSHAGRVGLGQSSVKARSKPTAADGAANSEKRADVKPRQDRLLDLIRRVRPATVCVSRSNAPGICRMLCFR